MSNAFQNYPINEIPRVTKIDPSYTVHVDIDFLNSIFLMFDSWPNESRIVTNQRQPRFDFCKLETENF